MFLSSNSFYVLCLFREVVKPLFLLMNVVLLADLLPLYFIYHRLPLPNSVSVIHCIVQLVARPGHGMRQILQPSSASSLFYKYIPRRRKTPHLAPDPDHRREGQRLPGTQDPSPSPSLPRATSRRRAAAA
jgi:hypothetical protein